MAKTIDDTAEGVKYVDTEAAYSNVTFPKRDFHYSYRPDSGRLRVWNRYESQVVFDGLLSDVTIDSQVTESTKLTALVTITA